MWCLTLAASIRVFRETPLKNIYRCICWLVGYSFENYFERMLKAYQLHEFQKNYFCFKFDNTTHQQLSLGTKLVFIWNDLKQCNVMNLFTGDSNIIFSAIPPCWVKHCRSALSYNASVSLTQGEDCGELQSTQLTAGTCSPHVGSMDTARDRLELWPQAVVRVSGEHFTYLKSLVCRHSE